MTTTYSHSTLDSQPSFDWKAALAEPFLIVATSAFWLVTLPLRRARRLQRQDLGHDDWILQRQANPLILRRGNMTSSDPSLAQRRSTKQA